VLDPTTDHLTLVDRFLVDMRDSHATISVYLVSGFQLKGEVVQADSDAILFNHRGVHQLVMRSAVATMYPVREHSHDGSEWWRGYVSA
jgi:host factor-I protein